MDIDEDGVLAAQGRKRLADDELAGEQRLTKRFHLLNLDNTRQLYIPTQQRSPTRRQRSNAVSDCMQVEDSKNRVYIYDLDEELAGADSDEERLVFLPDIEKKLAELPRSVLTNESAPKGNEMILYSVPESLSVPREQDNVRKAIIESRARAREAQLNAQHGEPDSNIYRKGGDERSQKTHPQSSYMKQNTLDDDAMDLGG